MARIRTIKPEFPQSESMGRVSREARLCFVLIWTICDDSGRTRAASRMLASLLYPYDDDAANHIEGWLDELEAEGCIVRYAVDGSHYLQVKKWSDHQKIDKPSKSRIPTPPEPSRILANIPDTPAKPLERSSEDLGREGTRDLGREGNGEEKGDEPPVSSPDGQKEVFTLPEWIPQKTWDEFQKVRKKKRAACTPYAHSLVVRELVRIRDQLGQDPVMVLNKSITSGWADVYELKGGGNGNRPGNHGSAGAAFKETGRARSDGAPYPVDAEC